MSSAAIHATNRRFEEAAARGDAKGMAAVYTSDGIAMPPDAPIISGREAIAELWGSVIKGMGLKGVKLETLNLEVTGDTACEVGRATLSLAPPGGAPAEATVKFVVLWKNEGGNWKWHRDIWNPMPA